jgi:hypothetical protein
MKADLSRRSAVAILGSIALVLAYVYFAYVDYPYLDQRIGTHVQILSGVAAAPFRYRVLVPFSVEPVIRGLLAFQPYRRAFLLAYAFYDAVVFLLLTTTLYVYVRLYFSRTESLVGILFAAATMPVALRDHFFQPWSPLETVFFSLGLLLNHQRRYGLLGVIVVLAALNRETALFLIIALWFTRPGSQRSLRTWAVSSVYLLLWLAIFFGLRWVRGATRDAITVADLWAANTASNSIVRALVNTALFGGAFWAFAILGLRYAPPYVRKSAYVVPFYVASVMLFGVWFEVRLLMPLYPILIPLGLSYLYRPVNVPVGAVCA